MKNENSNKSSSNNIIKIIQMFNLTEFYNINVNK